MLQSRLLILGMLLLAIVMSLAAVWYLRGLSRRSLEFWGPTNGELILHAPQVELLRLAPGEATEVVQRRDLSQARGLANLRRALMQDASFDWDVPAPLPPARWDHALRFRDGDRETTLLISHDPPQAALLGSHERVSTRPIAAGLHAFFAE